MQRRPRPHARLEWRARGHLVVDEKSETAHGESHQARRVVGRAALTECRRGNGEQVYIAPVSKALTGKWTPSRDILSRRSVRPATLSARRDELRLLSSAQRGASTRIRVIRLPLRERCYRLADRQARRPNTHSSRCRYCRFASRCRSVEPRRRLAPRHLRWRGFGISGVMIAELRTVDRRPCFRYVFGDVVETRSA